MNPSLAGSGSRHGNLPAELSSFVGRAADLSRLAELHAQAPLLTLVGPGGVGKTRLALRLAADVQDSYPDGSWLVDVAPLTEPNLVGQAAADVLGIREEPGQTWLKTLAKRLPSSQLLLILDNCDHLAASCAELAQTLLRACPDVHILATSRQPLDTAGERVWRVQPLVASEAVSLFVARAKARRPDFRLTDDNLGLVAEVCRRLDGLPLAVELVAARVESLDLPELAARLDTGLRLRVTGPRAAPARQQTLRATLDWSVKLLTRNEAALLRRLAVFANGWTTESAQAVCADASLPVTSIAGLLERLVTRSLVLVEQSNGSARYWLPETVREYVLEWLDESDEAAHFRWRHAAYFLELAELAPPEELNPAHAAVLEREQEELRAALDWSTKRPELELGLRLATGAYSLWYFRSHFAEGRAWLERLLAQARTDWTAWATRAQVSLAHLLVQQGEYSAAEIASQAALDKYMVAGDALGIALASRLLGKVALWRGDLARARTLLGEAARRLRDLGNSGEFGALFNCATVALELGDTNGALELAADIEQRGQVWQPVLSSAWAMFLRGSVAARDGDTELAGRLLSRALELQQPLVYHQLRLELLTEWAHTLLDQNKVTEAKSALAEALQEAYEAGLRLRLTRALDGVARVAAVGHLAEAVRLAGATAALRATLGVVPWPGEVLRAAGWLPAARRKLGEHVYRAAWVSGQTSTVDEAADLARSLLDAPDSQAERNASPLTRRETEVAALLAGGLSTRQIAAQLVISVATVRVHVDHIMAKLDLHSRTQVAVWVREHAELTELQMSR